MLDSLLADRGPLNAEKVVKDKAYHCARAEEPFRPVLLPLTISMRAAQLGLTAGSECEHKARVTPA